MIKGIAYALGACLIWGLIFIVPGFMEGFSSIEVALGRYLVYGVISLLIFFNQKFKGVCNYPLSIWFKASLFSLMSTMVYYTSVVLALRYSTPAICTLILGISPITICFYGNWKEKNSSFKSLIPTSLLIILGIVIINIPNLQLNDFSSEYALGLGFSFVALTAWSLYVVENSKFLKSNPQVSSNDWSTLIGVTTLCWVLFFGFVTALIFSNAIEFDKYYALDQSFVSFVIGCLVLGILCSWLGSYLWNQASFHLPVTLAGQLTIFETIFGVLFVYLLAGEFPLQLECIGIVILLGAVIYGIQVSNKEVLAS